MSGMMQTSDYPCMRKSIDVPDMHFRNFEIPVSAACVTATSPAALCTRVALEQPADRRLLDLVLALSKGYVTPTAASLLLGSLQLPRTAT